jgi:Icc protein
MRIIQLTDLHLGREGDDSHGVDVRKNFLNLLEKIPAYDADELIITGDLCLNKGDATVYKWIYEQLEPLGLPVRVISGNHDESSLLAKAFGLKPFLRRKELFYLRTETPVPIFYLDTAKGRVSKQQLSWLEEEIPKCIDPIILFMHHPPLLAGVPYMDRKYALKNREDLQQILLTHSDLIHIYCGHYHVEKLLSYYNLLVHITPSTYFQMNQFQEDFAIDHHRIGFRVIDLLPNQIRSTVVYADGACLPD